VRGRHYRAEAEIICAGGTLPADVRESPEAALTGAMETERLRDVVGVTGASFPAPYPRRDLLHNARLPGLPVASGE
jgi:hypothetical protein